MARIGRRRYLETAVGITTLTAGCTGTGRETTRDADVIAGPDGRATFEPETVTVPVDETVSWAFETAGHNLSCRPGDSDRVALPDDATPFATHDPDESPMTLVPAGTRFTHTFSVPGTYVYVCVPHVRDGMIGRVAVEA